MNPGDDEAFLEDWEDIYLMGSILRDMMMAFAPYDPAYPDDNELTRPESRFVADVNAIQQPPPYSADLISLLQEFEWEGQERGATVRNLPDLANQFPTSDRIVDTLLPLAQRKAREFRTKPWGAEASRGYYDRLDVSWTRPMGLMPFLYNTKYAHAAGDAVDDDEADEDDDDDNDDDDNVDDDEDEGDEDDEDDEDDEGDDDEDDDADDDADRPASPPAQSPEFVRMQKLSALHRWNDARPRYEVVPLRFGPAS